MGRTYQGVQDNFFEGTRQISSVTQGKGVIFLGKPKRIDTKERGTTV